MVIDDPELSYPLQRAPRAIMPSTHGSYLQQETSEQIGNQKGED